MAKKPTALSNADIAILQTLNFQKKLDSGAPIARREFLLVPPEVLRPIRPGFNPQDEKMMASGQCRMMTWRSPGDGSYNATGVPTVLTGFANRRGTAMMAGAAAASIGMNLASSKRAKRDAQPRWMDYIPQGMMTVSSFGFYIEDYEHGLMRWGWDVIQSAEWKAPSTVELIMSTPTWSGRVLLISDWAELLFVGWIHAAFPQHPGKHAWVTEDWANRIREVLGIEPF